MKTHNMQITPTDLRGADSGRVRYRVTCTACGVLVHDATTGPVHAVRDHFEGRPGYERPLARTVDAVAALDEPPPTEVFDAPLRERPIVHMSHLALYCTHPVCRGHAECQHPNVGACRETS